MPVHKNGATNYRADGFSLLWPSTSLESSSAVGQLNARTARDLGLAHIIDAFTPEHEHKKEIEKVLNLVCLDVDTIRYRQDVITDLLQHPELSARLEVLLPTIDALGKYSFRVVKDMTTLHEVTWRMGELMSIIDCVQGLGDAFQQVNEKLRSQALIHLRDMISQVQEDPIYQNLVRELPDLLGLLRTCASVTIGVNLDQFLRPVEAVLLSVNEKKFTSQSLLNQMFGKQVNPQAGIAPLHSVPKRAVDGHYALPISSELGWAVEPLMVPLFKDLADVIEKITRPIARELKRYTEIRSKMFVNLRQDVIFYLGALRFIHRMQGHRLPMCLPDIASVEERVCNVENAYNPYLVLHLSGGDPEKDLSESIKTNTVEIGESGRILILTGPNQGGKTTYMQGVGLIQVLAQIGLYVPGSQARISPVDAIFTHFPLEERLEEDTGRFGDEAKRLSEIFRHVTQHSLVLLNESLASTSAGESLYLAQDVVRILRRIGTRAIYSTHLHELAAGVVELNQDTSGESRIVSLVASPLDDGKTDRGEILRSYKIEKRPPLGRSYAQEIAERYGIGYGQLEQILKERGILQDRSSERKSDEYQE